MTTLLERSTPNRESVHELITSTGEAASPHDTKRLSPKVIELFGFGIAVLILVMITLGRRLSTDVFWSMTAGQWILTHHALFGTDAFTYTEPHRRWIANEWGSDVVLAGLDRVFGNAAYNLFPIGTGLLSVGALWGYLRALGARGGRIAFALALFGYGISSVIVQDRGLSFSLIWLPAELWILTRARSNPRWLWLLAPLFVFWVNTHGSVLLGLAVIGIELAWSLAPERSVARLGGFGQSRHTGPLALSLVAALIACCLTPYGAGLLADDLRVTFNGQIGRYIQEWSSPDFHSIGLLIAFCVPLLVVLLVIRSRRLPLLELSLALVFLLATLHANRFIVYFFVAACGLAATFPSRAAWGRLARQALGILTVGLCVVMLGAPTVSAGSLATSTPVAAFNFLASHPGRIFTEYAWEDYAVFRHRPTFVDGRTDYFTGSVLTEYMDVTNLTTRPDPVFDQYRVDYVIWARGAPLSLYLERDPAWKVVDRTPQALVFARTSVGSPPGTSASFK